MMLEELEYINVLLANSSVSFCHYDNHFFNGDKNQFISSELLREVILFSTKHDLYLNILYGNESLPSEITEEINKADHLKLVPLNNADSKDECIVILDEQDYNNISLLPEDRIETIILRIGKNHLPEFAKLSIQFSEKCKKLNIVLAGLEGYSATDLGLYEEQIKELTSLFSDRLKRGSVSEINCLSDRVVLKKMNNCNAGIKHITFAPDGNFYLCPGFYHDKSFGDIGNISDGIDIKNPELLSLDKSPICGICDAYHCKRCIYLNKKMTAEINIPSYEQCVCSHIERNGSRSLIAELKYSNNQFQNLMGIEQLPYLDPFVKLKKDKGSTAPNKKRSIDDLPPLEPLIITHTRKKNSTNAKKNDPKPLNEKEILEKIHNTQVDILKMLKYLRGI